MARNEEKHAGRLNRIWLQQLDEERLKKNPLRPGLGSLRTAAEIKKWIPSIKNDIDFYLKQSQVGCYPDRKISEFTSKIEGLTKEYKAYLRKYRELEGSHAETPWTDRPYSRKHKLPPDSTTESKGENSTEDNIPAKKFTPLSVPLLENEDSYKELYGYDTLHNASVSLNSSEIVDIPPNSRNKSLYHQVKSTHCDNNTYTQGKHKQLTENNYSCINDKPLDFNIVKIDGYRSLKGKRNDDILSTSNTDSDSICTCVQASDSPMLTTPCRLCSNISSIQPESTNNKETQKVNDSEKTEKHLPTCNHGNQNILGLAYSDSSGDEDSS